MKTVTADFDSAQADSGMIGVRRVYYKRRRWNTSSLAFEWETSWIELDADQIRSFPPINWNLDNDQLNEFKVANITVVVDNSYNQWNTDNATGIFKQDSDSPFWPYEPNLMKFQVRGGLILADGTEELVNIFTGVATEYTFDSNTKTCQIQIQGLEKLLQNTKAEGIATSVDQELIGTGNASDTEFTTSNPGVGEVTLVTLDGIRQVEGVDYEVSQTNDASLGAKVTFNSAPDTSVAIKASYYYWPQDYEFSEIVEALLDAAGIPSGDQFVEGVSFENNVLNSFEFTTQSEFDSGTLQYLSSSVVPGSLYLDPTGVKESTNWSTTMTGWTVDAGTAWTSDGTELDGDGTGGKGPGILVRSSTAVIGAWEWKVKMTTGAVSLGYMASGSDGSNSFTDAYYIVVNYSSGVVLIAKAIFGGSFTLAFGSWSADTSYHTWTVTRNGSGEMVLYLDGSAILSCTDTSITTSTKTGLIIPINAVASVKEIQKPPATVAATWTSGTLDQGFTPSAWLPSLLNYDDGNTTFKYETRSSTNGSTWDAYVEANASFIPQSALKRYVTVRISFTFSTSSSIDVNPYLNSITFRSISTSTTVTLPIFTGYTVYEAIQKLGEFTNYEYGFTPDEDFFFRPRDTGASVLSVSQSDFVSRVHGAVSGNDRAYGIVRVVYGTYAVQLESTPVHPTHPLARAGERRFEIEPDSNIVISANADIATGIAQGYFKYLSSIKRRFKTVTKFLPQLEISDVVTVTLINNQPNPAWFWGDPNQYWGKDSISYYGKDEQFVYGLKMRVLAAQYNLNTFECEFELEEVPQ